jgi:hypothetical protein
VGVADGLSVYAPGSLTTLLDSTSSTSIASAAATTASATRCGVGSLSAAALDATAARRRAASIRFTAVGRLQANAYLVRFWQTL